MLAGFVRVDAYLRTSAPHVFAAGDVTGRLMLVPQAMQDGFVAATNAVRGATMTLAERGQPDRQLHRPGVRPGGPDRGEGPRRRTTSWSPSVRFDATTRTIIDGRTRRLLQADRRPRDAPRSSAATSSASGRSRSSRSAAIAMAGGMRVDDLARVPLSFPTYAGILGRAAYRASEQLHLEAGRRAHQGEP